jgi:hypothetical protein
MNYKIALVSWGRIAVDFLFWAVIREMH